MSWLIDKSETSIEFSVRHFLTNTVQGRFGSFDVDVVLDPEHPQRSSVSAAIDVASLDTGNADRDRQLRSAAILDVEQFPQITFVSTQVARMLGNTFWLRGDLTIHGVTRTIRADGEFVGPTAENGSAVVRFTFAIDIDRRDYLNIPASAGGVLIGNTVLIVVRASVRLAPSAD